MIKNLLTHPLMRNRDLDDPMTTELRKQLIHQKKFLEQIYVDWYKLIQAEIPQKNGPILEIGSGAGFLDQYLPGLIKTEVFYLSNMDVILDAAHMPFSHQKITAVIMTDVFHHLSEPRQFLREVIRIMPVGGKMVMIEPWVTQWSSFIYPRFHHEPFNPRMESWEFPSTGPLSTSNQALPWIIFIRDREKFAQEFPQLQIIHVQPMLPFRYLLSGGVSLHALMPGWSTPFWRWVEKMFEPVMDKWGMFALVGLEKVKN